MMRWINAICIEVQKLYDASALKYRTYVLRLQKVLFTSNKLFSRGTVKAVRHFERRHCDIAP